LLVGLTVGRGVGNEDGAGLGAVGLTVGVGVGRAVGCVGAGDGTDEGKGVGRIVGSALGSGDGAVGLGLGTDDGRKVGRTVGRLLGRGVGCKITCPSATAKRRRRPRKMKRKDRRPCPAAARCAIPRIVREGLELQVSMHHYVALVTAYAIFKAAVRRSDVRFELISGGNAVLGPWLGAALQRRFRCGVTLL